MRTLVEVAIKLENLLQLPASLEKLGFKDNDLFICSIAMRNNLTIVSSDNDFYRMGKADDTIRIESWIKSPVL